MKRLSKEEELKEAIKGLENIANRSVDGGEGGDYNSQDGMPFGARCAVASLLLFLMGLCGGGSPTRAAMARAGG